MHICTDINKSKEVFKGNRNKPLKMYKGWTICRGP